MDAYNTSIVKDILADKRFTIKEVHNLKEINTFPYDRNIYQIVEKCVSEKNLEPLYGNLTENKDNSEFLCIMSFNNEKGELFIITIYDSDELWQDPEIPQFFQYSQSGENNSGNSNS
jgi:hypothetical protein